MYTYNLIWYFFVYEHCWQKRRGGRKGSRDEGRERKDEGKKEAELELSTVGRIKHSKENQFRFSAHQPPSLDLVLKDNKTIILLCKHILQYSNWWPFHRCTSQEDAG